MAIPFIKDFTFTYGEAAEVTPLITRVVANNPGPFTFVGTGTYIIGDERGVAVIDPGPHDENHIEAVMAAAAGPVDKILVTHTHLDHSGGVGLLKDRTGAEVLAFGGHPSGPDNAAAALDEGADFRFTPDRLLRHGDVIRLAAATLEAIHTPGHCANHLCFALAEEGALFTGDHIMGWSTSVVAPPDGDMEDYLQSLELLLNRQDKVYYPTHGAPIINPRPFVQAIKEHRAARDKGILAALGSTALTAMDVAKIVYTDIDPRLHIAAALNVTAHLDRHVRWGTVLKSEDGYRLAA